MNDTSTLERELAAFQAALPALLANPANLGKYALVFQDRIDSIWDSVDLALDAGYQQFELAPFLIQEIVAVETPRSFSRNLTRCP